MRRLLAIIKLCLTDSVKVIYFILTEPDHFELGFGIAFRYNFDI